MSIPAKRGPSADQAALLRHLPSVDEMLLRPRIVTLCNTVDRGYAVTTVREVLNRARREIIAGQVIDERVIDADVLEQQMVQTVEAELTPSHRAVINASGVILHTNLGRAPLAFAAIEELRVTATQYSNLEYDLSTGTRGKRDVHLSRLIERMTGAEAAIVANNCAAAVLLTLAALARGGEVIVSRGELIEIGDGFRIPEIMEQSGAVLREVGTTNRTRIADYENAINEKTRLLLRVHRSNFTVTGFTEKPEVAELISLGASRGLPVIDDLGSGCLVDLSAAGIHEPSARESIEAGFSMVLFSGDKLLGGPQAGILAGEKELVKKVRGHPLFRALRVDKLTITAMEATLRAYLRAAWNEIPSQQMIRATVEEIARRARQLCESLAACAASSGARIEIVEGNSLVGGGSTPAQSLPTKLLRVTSSRCSAAELERRLRSGSAGIPVIARIEDDGLILDLRTVFPGQEIRLAEAVIAAVSEK
jgi:L-seryl-tRNA(Ser) seleniumtransferase